MSDKHIDSLHASSGITAWKPRIPLSCLRCLASAGVIAAIATTTIPATIAYADDDFAEVSALTSASEIDALAKAYDAALKAVGESDDEVDAIRKQVSELAAQLQEQESVSDEALVRLYKLQNNGYSTVEVLLGADSLQDFFKMVDYLDAATQRNLSELKGTIELRDRFVEEQKKLERRQSETQEQLQDAESALRAAQNARAGRQSAGISNGYAQDPGAYGLDDGVNWYATHEEFVAEWAPRIDAYLAGSPMAGLGSCFAEASWRYCVDPRWSPAIANTESSKGAKCVRAYNAWGWGASDEDPVGLALQWDSWETAIDTHVRGLSSYYGYTISLASAQKYCTDWKDWYANTLSEMSAI